MFLFSEPSNPDLISVSRCTCFFVFVYSQCHFLVIIMFYEKWLLKIPFSELFRSFYCKYYTTNMYLWFILTVWCNQMGTVFTEMSSWTALICHTVMRKYFREKVWKANIFGSFLWRFYILKVIEENAYLKKYST